MRKLKHSEGDAVFAAKLPLRLLATTWCLATAVLVASYSSLLITYLLTPNDSPLINSMKDVVKNADYHLVVQKGRNFDAFLSV